jgi:hypothetical protein
MKDNKLRWAVYDEGLKIWYNGELIAQIEPEQFPFLLADIAVHLQYQHAEGRLKWLDSK